MCDIYHTSVSFFKLRDRHHDNHRRPRSSPWPGKDAGPTTGQLSKHAAQPNRRRWSTPGGRARLGGGGGGGGEGKWQRPSADHHRRQSPGRTLPCGPPNPTDPVSAAEGSRTPCTPNHHGPVPQWVGPTRLTQHQTRRLASAGGRSDPGATARRLMNIGHANVQSIVPKMDCVNRTLQDYYVYMFCLSETWLTATVQDRVLVFPGYRILRDRAAPSWKKAAVPPRAAAVVWQYIIQRHAERHGSAGGQFRPLWAGASPTGGGGGRGGGGPDPRTFENRAVRPPRFENEVAKTRCFFPIFRVFWGRLATLPMIRPPYSKIRGDAPACETLWVNVSGGGHRSTGPGPGDLRFP